MASIQGVYVALFGRPADPTGLAYFNAATQNGQNLTAIGDLASTAEYKTRFENKDNNQIVASIYQSLFNRDPDADGLNFFVNALNTGALNINNIAIAILDGAQGSDKTIVDAKIASANAFTTALDTPVEVAAYAGKAGIDAGVAFLTGITTTAKTAADADAAVKTLVDAGNAGNAVAVAIGTEVTVGDVGSTTQSSDKNDTITYATIAAVSTAAAKANGGFGTDTVIIKTAASGVAATYIATPELTSVEKLYLTAAGDAAANFSGAITLDLSKSTSVKEVWNDASTDGDTAGNGAVTLTNVALGTTVGLKGTVTGATSVSFKDVDGSSDAATVTFDGAKVTGATSFAGIEVLNISSTGASSVTNLFGAKEIKISGSGEFTNIAVAAGDTTTVTNSSTASVAIDLSSANKLATYTGSAAVDKVTLDTDGLTANVAINTGAGNDIISVGTGASAYTLTLTGGAGNDLFAFNGTLVNVADAAKAEFAKSLVTITDFNAAEDVLSIKAALTGSKATLNNVDLGSIASATDLFAAVGVAAAAAGAGNHAIFAYQGDTYIFNNDATAAFGAGDGLVKIAGLAAVSSLTDANFI